MIQRCFARATSSRSLVFSGRFDNQYLRGSPSSLGHSIRSHSCSRGCWGLWSQCAARTRTAAKRERRGCRVPSRHVTVFQAFEGNASACCLADRGACSASRRRRLAGLPQPEYLGAGSGCTESFWEDEDRVVPASRPASSSCAQCFVGMARAIGLCCGIGFSVSIDSVQRLQGPQSRQHPGEEHPSRKSCRQICGVASLY